MSIDLNALALNTATIEYLEEQVGFHETQADYFFERLSEAYKAKEEILGGKDV